ncbi:MAG: hypothetical protein V1262_11705, partial [Alphaproteobacteria bacterium]|nr:hypothetical protein [Alphaproteobacteria bacterium]
NQNGVPANMINMEMGAEDNIDTFRRIAGGSEIGKKRTLQLVPTGIAPELVVADAGVDNYAAALRLDDEGLDATFQLPVIGGEMWPQPGFGQDVLGRKVAVAKIRCSHGTHFNNARDNYITDPPTIRRHRLAPK